MRSKSMAAFSCALCLSLMPPLRAQQADPGDDTLRVNSRLVILDVSVTDGKGNPVHGLTAADFDLRENGTLEKIGSCEEHALTLMPATPVASMVENLHHFETPSTAQVPTPTVLLLDLLNTAPLDQAMMRNYILQFLQKQPAGAQIAIFGLSNRLYLLQPFTSDPNLLRQAILLNGKDARNTTSKNNRISTDSTTGSAANTAHELAAATTEIGLKSMLTELAYKLNQFEGVSGAGEETIQLQQTMNALVLLANYLGPLPGKKNLIWFSPGVPFTTLPDETMQRPYDAVVDASGPLERVIGLMSKGRIAVYPVDPRGTDLSPATMASFAVRDEFQRIRANDQYASRTMMQHVAAGEIAKKTGGAAFFNINDLSGTISKVIHLGSNYYSISYTPNDPKWNGHFRKLQLALRQKGYHLAYRDGYFAGDLSAPLGDQKVNIAGVMKGAMLYGAPSRGDLPFTADIDLAAASEDEPDAKTEMPPNTKGPYSRYRLDYKIDAHQVMFTEHTEGVHEGTVRFLLLAYDPQGNVVASTNNVLVGRLPAKSYEHLLNTGIRLHQEVSVPQRGNYTFRIAVEDLSNGHVGAIEVPAVSVAGKPGA